MQKKMPKNATKNAKQMQKKAKKMQTKCKKKNASSENVHALQKQISRSCIFACIFVCIIFAFFLAFSWAKVFGVAFSGCVLFACFLHFNQVWKSLERAGFYFTSLESRMKNLCDHTDRKRN